MWAVRVPQVVFQCRLQKLDFLQWHPSVEHFQLRFSSGIPVWGCFKFFQWFSSVPCKYLLGRPVVSQCTLGQPMAFQSTLDQPVYTDSMKGTQYNGMAMDPKNLNCLEKALLEHLIGSVFGCDSDQMVYALICFWIGTGSKCFEYDTFLMNYTTVVLET